MSISDTISQWTCVVIRDVIDLDFFFLWVKQMLFVLIVFGWSLMTCSLPTMHDDNNTVTAFYQQYVSWFSILDLLSQFKIMNIMTKKVMFKMNNPLFAVTFNILTWILLMHFISWKQTGCFMCFIIGPCVIRQVNFAALIMGAVTKMTHLLSLSYVL